MGVGKVVPEADHGGTKTAALGVINAQSRRTSNGPSDGALSMRDRLGRSYKCENGSVLPPLSEGAYREQH